MQLRFVGCGDALGSGGRSNTCFHVTGRGANFLIDCGASSLPALKRLGIARDDIDLILITHFHGDHFAGLPFLLLDAQFSRRARPLVIAGPEGWKHDATIARLRQLPSGMRYLGYVAEQDLPALFAGAAAFVYPSLYEGFGFPVAQAMAAGTPVITSAVSALPEIAGGAAILIDPRSETELREAMQTLLTSPAQRARMIESGRANARRFSWTENARQSLRFFEELTMRTQ